jgi:hypothetical protein
VGSANERDTTNPGVVAFFKEVASSDAPLHVAAATIGELRRAIERIRHRGDVKQAQALERWLGRLLGDFGDSILAFDADAAQVWGRLRVPHPENPLDKQIAATALIHDLVLVTRNVKHFSATGVKLLNPFAQ